MKPPYIKTYEPKSILTGITFLVLGGVLTYALVQIQTLEQQVKNISTELASTTMTLSLTSGQLSKNITELDKQAKGLSSTLSDTQQHIDAVKTQVGGVAQTVGSISGTVGNLQKLASIDPEILKKYSKVYFMNENYTPAHLTPIPSEYIYSNTRSEQFLTEAYPHLKDMLDAAKAEGITLYVKSGYRSFAEQKSLKTSYSVIYGAGTANTFSADQGYSEHQLGTTVDFITTGLGGKVEGFDTTKAYVWLTANAHRFGFVLSYPKGNTFYVYEPWHWRYVGVRLATFLHDNNTRFYDVDQRELDTFLADTF